jgi:hypothetical protein
MLVRIELTSASLITGYRYDTSANGSSVGWEVIEFAPGVIKTVQRGNTTYDASPKNITLGSTFNMAKTQVDYLGFRINSGVPLISYTQVYMQLTSTTNLQLTSGAIVSQDVGWQVVEWY